MDRYKSVLILFIVTFNLNFSAGYKWVEVKEGHPLPNNTLLFSSTTFVGRVRISNVIIPAEIFNSSYAVAYDSRNKQIIAKNGFEIFTATERCDWQEFDDFSEVPENVVRVGKAWNYEPIYLGRYSRNGFISILMTSKKFLSPSQEIFKLALICEDDNKWIDMNTPQMLQNAITINTNNDIEHFVARMVGPVSYIPASINNNNYACSTIYENIVIKSLSCELLVGKLSSDEYSWQKPGEFERIPENAVVVGMSENYEFNYVIRDHYQRLKWATFSTLFSAKMYDILIKNV